MTLIDVIQMAYLMATYSSERILVFVLTMSGMLVAVAAAGFLRMVWKAYNNVGRSVVEDGSDV